MDYSRIRHIISIGVIVFIVGWFGARGVLGIPAYPYEDGVLYVHILDVGQGDSILIHAPNGKNMLIDGGPNTNVLDPLGRLLGFGIHTIDLMLLTHPHADHVSGLLAVIHRLKVGKIWYTGNVHTTGVFRAWLLTAQKKSIPMEVPIHGAHEWGGMTVRVLFPDEERSAKRDWIEGNNGLNDTSLVVKITYGDTAFLFPGDAEIALENFLLEHEYLKADMLKVGHQGSRTSTQQAFLDEVDPSFAAISVGENDYGHPHSSVIKRLNKKGVRLHRTDYHGIITYVSDGKTISVRTER